MNIIYFGFNALSSCLDMLIQQNQHVVAVFTGEDDTHCDQILSIAAENNIPVYSQAPNRELLKRITRSQQVDGFISAEYPHKIPLLTEISYALNIHPTLLPEGRGQTPLPHLILHYPESAGITIHKMTDEFDQGDILFQKPFRIDDLETFDSLSLKLFVEAPILLIEVLNHIDHFYSQAKQQATGSYWPSFTVESQTIDWCFTTTKIDKICRAFGSLGVKIKIAEQSFYVSTAQCIVYEHGYEAGDVISSDDYKVTIATIDGMMIIPSACLHKLDC